MDRNYGGVIWTNHALQRLEERNIKQGDAWAAWKRPDSSKYDPKKSAWVYRRILGAEEFEVVAKKSEKGEWLILSAWSNPVGGDFKDKKSKSFLQKLFSFFR